jgi:hypothetical protein
MWKPTVLVAAALAVAGSSIVYAQEHFTAADRDGPRIELRHRLSPEDRAAFIDAGIAALKAGLELTPEQAKNWPDFEKALRDRAQLRAERIAAREAVEQNSLDVGEALKELLILLEASVIGPAASTAEAQNLIAQCLPDVARFSSSSVTSGIRVERLSLVGGKVQLRITPCLGQGSRAFHKRSRFA